MKSLHSLLVQQLEQHGVNLDALPSACFGLLDTVSETYRQFQEQGKRITDKSENLLGAGDGYSLPNRASADPEAYSLRDSSSISAKDNQQEMLQVLALRMADALSQSELYNQAIATTQNQRDRSKLLHRELHSLLATQVELIQSEKNSSLEQLIFDTAREINNTINFIYGYLSHVTEYVQDMVELLHLYRQFFPEPGEAISAKLKESDLDFIVEDIPKLLSSITSASDRIRNIVRCLRNFSRLDEAENKQANINDNIDCALKILHSRLHPSGESQELPGDFDIQVIKEYGDLPLVKCYHGQLNHVFMAILENAIDALHLKFTNDRGKWQPNNFENVYFPTPVSQFLIPTIRIRTEVIKDFIVIRIADNGIGISKSIENRIFEPFFTTKPIGKGCGFFGLSISQHIVQKHGGVIIFESELGQGTEFGIKIPIKN